MSARVRRIAGWIVLLCLVRVGGTFGGERRALPAAEDLRRCILEVVRSYPTDGTHGYYWPKDSAWAGTTRDLVYDGTKVADGDPQGRCYCCGLTFEVLVRAWERLCLERREPFRIHDLSAEDLLRFRGLWYGTDGTRSMIPHALETLGIGTTVQRWEDARAGDFVQLWRHSGSGHSVVFLAWVKDAEGRRTGIRYWSSQKATRGIGEREESIGADGVDAEQIFIGRAGAAAPAPRKR